MATPARQTSTVLGTLARRFAGQMLLSGAVMLTLNAATRIDLGLGDLAWPDMADRASPVGPKRQDVVLPVLDLAATMAEGRGSVAVAEAQPPGRAATSPAALREARLPVPARLHADSRQTPSAAETPSPPVWLAAPAKHAAPAVAAGFELARAEGVLLFDQCRPACETQDPLARRPPAERTMAPPPPSPRARLAALAPAQAPAEPDAIVAEAEMQGPFPPVHRPAPPPAAGLWSRSLSTARDTTRAAADGLARLVNW